MCCNNYIKVFSKILLFGFFLVFNFGSNILQGSEPLKIVRSSDKYPATVGPFLSARTVDGKWNERPYKFASIRYVATLPDDAILTKTAYYSKSTGKAYFYVSDAEKIYLPGTYVIPAVEINNNLDKFGLGTVEERRRQIDSIMFNVPDLVDSSSLWNKILLALTVWIVSALVLGLPVVVLILGWRRMFQMFLIREIGKAVRGREDGRED